MSVRNTPRGLFIAVEGMDGSGKSFGTGLLGDYLQAEGLALVRTREIGGTYYGEAVRSLILNTATPVDPFTRFLATLSTRHQHLQEVIRPNIAKGISVLTDRYFDSTFVYQGYMDNQMSAYWQLAGAQCTEHLFVRPDITVFFQVDPAVAYERGIARTNVDNDQYKQGLETAQRVALGYQRMIDGLGVQQRKNFLIVNGNQDIEAVKTDLQSIARTIVSGYKDPQ